MSTINNSYGRVETAEMIATAAIVFVRKARAEGYTNKLDAQTIDGMAQELGINPKRWTWSTAIRIVKANAKLMGETDLLDLDPAPVAEAPAVETATPAPATYANVRRYLGRQFKLSRMATGRRSGQRWSEGVTVRITMRGIVVEYRESSACVRSDGSHGAAMLAEVRASLAARWATADDPYRNGALIISSAQPAT